jgi:hypothetical protein
MVDDGVEVEVDGVEPLKGDRRLSGKRRGSLIRLSCQDIRCRMEQKSEHKGAKEKSGTKESQSACCWFGRAAHQR